MPSFIEPVKMKDGGREVVDLDIDDCEDEEEEEEGLDEYEKDGFIVDDDVEEEKDEKEKQKKKRKKRGSGKNFVLDEDDYELLEDNKVPGFRRPQGGKMFKRLKKAGKDTEQGEPSGFSDDEGPYVEDISEEEVHPHPRNQSVGEDDEMADFIVDEEEIDKMEPSMRGSNLKKNKPRNFHGVPLFALEEANDIFGDVNELLMIRKQELAQSSVFNDSGRRNRRPRDEIEPSVIAEKYLTEKDYHIRGIDVPERIQVYEESTGPPPVNEMSTREESSWILDQLATNMIPTILSHCGTEVSEKINKEDIVRFLNLIHVEKFDVPFITMYRKEQCLSLLKDPEVDKGENEEKDAERIRRLKWHKLLWTIKDLDRKWLLLQKRKSVLQLYYNKHYKEECSDIIDPARLNLNQKRFKSIIKSLKTAESEREVDDVDLMFNLNFPPGEVGVDEGQFKRPKRTSPYIICNKAGLQEVAGKFGCNSEQLGMLITLENVRMSLSALEDSRETPEKIASNFTSKMFESPQAVLKGARHMAAMEISYEPRIRKHVRIIFMDKAVVSTNPTPKGNISIDYFHPFAAIKCLRNKPISKFEDAQWLLIQKAEEEKLLEVSLKLPEDTLQNLITEFNEHYFSDGVSKCAQLWNEQCKLIMQDAISNILLPSMEKQARSLLTIRAKKWLLMEYGKQFWTKISVAPYHCKGKDGEPDKGTPPRVMACCWGPGNPATTFVMLDSWGEVKGVLFAGSLTLRPQYETDKQRKKKDQECILKFLTDHQPQIVVLGAANLSCARLKADIYEIIYKMVDEKPRDISQEMDGIKIVYGDESLPRLYEHSNISSCQLPREQGIVKRAVALGRYLQNPLSMVATLCGASRDIVSWKLHSLEHLLTPDEKYEIIEELMVDVTNQVGVDINLAASHDWLSAPLQFVSGLGPRKAAFLQRSLVKSGAVTNRKELIDHGLKTRKVFVNAIGFLRVRCNGMLARDSIVDVLDDTRIHPESYTLANDVALFVYKYFVQDDFDNDFDQELAIEYVKDNLGHLKQLDIDAYAEDYEEKKKEKKKETLCDIKMELLHGFRDWRNPYQEPSQDEEFYMLSGETVDTLSEGRIVHATVRHVKPQVAICVLDSGLTGILLKNDFSDEDIDLTNKLHEGDLLTCKIKLIQTSRCQVALTCKETELNQHQDYGDLDSYYCKEQISLLDKQVRTSKEEVAKKDFKSRMIVHPRFQNFSVDEAVKFLSDKEVGEIIFHPSSRGPSFLTLTLKIYDGVYAHRDIIEGGKDTKNVTSFLRLGKTLKIGDDIFEDLDEVMDRYVDPLVTNLKTMLRYRKFRQGSKGEVDKLLREQKSENPKKIAYCFGVCYDHPGAFILTYIRNTNPHHLYVSLYPNGFKFQQRVFEKIDRLVDYFQRHIDDLQFGSAESFRSVSARVQMRAESVGSFMDDSDKPYASSPKDRNDDKIGAGENGHPSGLPSGNDKVGGNNATGWGASISNNFGVQSASVGNNSSTVWGASISNNFGVQSASVGNNNTREWDGGISNISGVQNASGGTLGNNSNGGSRASTGISIGGSSRNEGMSYGGWTSFPRVQVQNTPGKDSCGGGGGGWGGSGNGGGGCGGSGSGGNNTGGWGGNMNIDTGVQNVCGGNWGGGTGTGVSLGGYSGNDGWRTFQNTPVSSRGWGGSSQNVSHSTRNWGSGRRGGRGNGSFSSGFGRGRGYGRGGSSNNKDFTSGWGNKDRSGGVNVSVVSKDGWGAWGGKSSGGNDGKGSSGWGGKDNEIGSNDGGGEEGRSSGGWDSKIATGGGANDGKGSGGGWENEGGATGNASKNGWRAWDGKSSVGNDGKGSSGWGDKDNEIGSNDGGGEEGRSSGGWDSKIATGGGANDGKGSGGGWGSEGGATGNANTGNGSWGNDGKGSGGQGDESNFGWESKIASGNNTGGKKNDSWGGKTSGSAGGSTWGGGGWGNKNSDELESRIINKGQSGWGSSSGGGSSGGGKDKKESGGGGCGDKNSNTGNGGWGAWNSGKQSGGWKNKRSGGWDSAASGGGTS